MFLVISQHKIENSTAFCSISQKEGAIYVHLHKPHIMTPLVITNHVITKDHRQPQFFGSRRWKFVQWLGFAFRNLTYLFYIHDGFCFSCFLGFENRNVTH